MTKKITKKLLVELRTMTPVERERAGVPSSPTTDEMLDLCIAELTRREQPWYANILITWAAVSWFVVGEHLANVAFDMTPSIWAKLSSAAMFTVLLFLGVLYDVHTTVQKEKKP